MSRRVCTVGFKAATGVSHAVEVEVETLLEAAVLGLARLKKDEWLEGLGPNTRLDIQVRLPATHHSLTVAQVQRWLNGTTSSPAETLKRSRLRYLLHAK